MPAVILLNYFCISFRTLCCVGLICFGHNVFAQCDSAYYSITTTSNIQVVNGIVVSLSSPTNIQNKRIKYETLTGYYLGEENITESLNISLDRPVTKIRIICVALTAPDYGKEFFSLTINGKFHHILPSEIITPAPFAGTVCPLQPNGSLKGNDIPDGDGSFILTFHDYAGLDNFQIKDSVINGYPNGAIYDIQIFGPCTKDPYGDTLHFSSQNVFTPNGDGMNESFRPSISTPVEQFKLVIFNRWGQAVFSTTDPEKAWDGEHSDSGVYFWVCNIKEFGRSRQTKKGIVSIVR